METIYTFRNIKSQSTRDPLPKKHLHFIQPLELYSNEIIVYVWLYNYEIYVFLPAKTEINYILRLFSLSWKDASFTFGTAQFQRNSFHVVFTLYPSRFVWKCIKVVSARNWNFPIQFCLAISWAVIANVRLNEKWFWNWWKNAEIFLCILNNDRPKLCQQGVLLMKYNRINDSIIIDAVTAIQT